MEQSIVPLIWTQRRKTLFMNQALIMFFNQFLVPEPDNDKNTKISGRRLGLDYWFSDRTKHQHFKNFKIQISKL